MKSKKKLFAELHDLVYAVSPEQAKHYRDVAVHGLKHRLVDDETYGKRSFIYIMFKNNTVRRAVQGQLIAAGFNVKESYHPEGSRVEVQVSYFKGYHWDE